MGRQMTLGVIVGNRGFFPSHLATSGRLEITPLEGCRHQAHRAASGRDGAWSGREL